MSLQARWLDGLRGYVGVAALLFVFGVLAFLLEIQSPSWVQWSGIEVHGVTERGLTYYTYGGQHYAIDNQHASSADTQRRPTTVWLSRSDPTDSTSAYIENGLDRWLDFTFVVGWFAAGTGLVCFGVLRKRHRRRRQIVTMGQFGSGISDEVVRRILAERQGRNRGIDTDALIRDE